MKWQLWKKIGLAFAVSVILTSLLVFGVYIEFRSVYHSNARVRHTGSVLLEISMLRSLLQDAETGQRGFNITGKDVFLEPYTEAVPRLESRLERLRILTKDNIYQQKNLDRLSPLVAEKLRFAERTIRIRREAGRDSVERLVSGGTGRVLMDSIRVVLNRMENHEQALLKNRMAGNSRSFNNVLRLIFIGGFATTLLSLAIGYYIIMRIHRSIEALSAVTRAVGTGDFSRRVTISSHDEIGELGAAFNKMTGDLESMRSEIYSTNENLRESNQALAKANSTLEEQNRELEQLNAEKNEFLGIAAHDLKNPLSAIKALSAIIMQETPTLSQDEIKEFSGDIHASSKQMFDLITNLLDVNAIERGGMQLAFDKNDLAFITSHVIDRNTSNAYGKNISISLEAPDDEIPVYVDQSAAKQILDNIISNAVKYSPHGKNIYVRVKSSRSCGIVEVEDQGPGFSEEDKKKLFTKFARLSAQPTGGEHSTGLGLSIVRRLCDMIGAKISVESEKDKGAKFIIEFPLANQ